VRTDAVRLGSTFVAGALAVFAAAFAFGPTAPAVPKVDDRALEASAPGSAPAPTPSAAVPREAPPPASAPSPAPDLRSAVDVVARLGATATGVETRSVTGYRRIPVQLAQVSSGIRCPDGSYLPLLNGVPKASPLARNRVAVLIDGAGVEWFEHADGSATTTVWSEMTHADGRTERIVRTLHNARIPDGQTIDESGK
jgi:hypothetical protein